MRKNWQAKERLFKTGLIASGALILLVVAGFTISLVFNSIPSLRQYGLSFISKTEWDPENSSYGAFPFIFGTLITAFLALAISLPFSLALTIFLGEYFKKGFFSSFIKAMVDLLAGIPSVVYGLAGVFFLIPVIQGLEAEIDVIPYGVGIVSASIVLALMIIPFSASLGKEVLELVPTDLKEGAYSLGATRFEVITKISVPYSISGIIAGIMLSLGRALGETVAVTMLIGNMNSMPENIFSPGQTIASLIANQFNEANDDMHRAALLELGLLLLVITAVINIGGKLVIKKMSVEK
ncbi:MAG: phosphate ABC transporter permease subunit PstC [Spirochaetaceae bacterium]|nr:MAG: phosphate ABC transporter permease subunit PstC [Spirochaetaceae bacterium]